MNVTITLDDQLVQKAEKIAAQRDTTLTGLISTQLENLFAQNDAAALRQRNLQALKESVEKHTVTGCERTWKREDIYERS